jgi:hypothetical protein
MGLKANGKVRIKQFNVMDDFLSKGMKKILTTSFMSKY